MGRPHALDRWATVALVLGLISVVGVALSPRAFELDRYFVPKELVLHVAALAGAAALVARGRRFPVDATDVLLAGFLVWSGVAALFATNPWLAQRALGVSVSAGLVFWISRRLGAAGRYRPLLLGVAVATVGAAGTALVQAYGIDSPYFSQSRVPGGSFGNRNFAAHVAAIGLPALVYSTLSARRQAGTVLGAIGAGVVAATLVLTRSRAAWLAVIASMACLAVLLLMARRHWRGGKAGGRFAGLVAAALVASLAAMFLPNRLNWRSESPYLDSARNLMDYTSGSGRGRVEQYRHSVRMAGANPLLGVGPGNWPVHYVRFAPPGDRSLATDGTAANPWPSSDWIAQLSERGVVAGLMLLGVFASLLIGAFGRWRELGGADAVLAKLTLAATLVATFTVSAFDAVLALAAPAFMAWCVFGATSGIGRSGREVVLSRRAWTIAVIGVLGVVGASAVRSAAQTQAIRIVGPGWSQAAWIRAAAWDPGSYRINLRVAELHAVRGRCAAARPYARAALSLFPYASPPRRLLQRCG